MKIRPLHDRVIVKREEEERKSPGGIVIPDTATEKPVFGKVVAVGKGKILENGEVRPLDVKVGDKILFGKYSGTEVKMDGDELVVMERRTLWPWSRASKPPAVIQPYRYQVIQEESRQWQLKTYVSVTTPGRACSRA